MFERYIGGQEVQVAVINGKPLGAIELKPRRKFYDSKAKYTKAAKTEHGVYIVAINVTNKIFI